jgi:hypothetical protein
LNEEPPLIRHPSALHTLLRFRVLFSFASQSKTTLSKPDKVNPVAASFAATPNRKQMKKSII